jgi:hypothetical protein
VIAACTVMKTYILKQLFRSELKLIALAGFQKLFLAQSAALADVPQNGGTHHMG